MIILRCPAFFGSVSTLEFPGFFDKCRGDAQRKKQDDPTIVT